MLWLLIVFQMLLPAFETQDIGLDLLAILNAFGVDETRLVQAGAGETQVFGTGGSDYVYVTGEGSETYNAKGGADIFLVGKDFGHDTIADVDFVLRGEAADEVRFAHAKSTDVYAYREGQDLVIEVKGTDDVLRIRDQFLGDMIDPVFGLVNAAPATRMSVMFGVSFTITGSFDMLVVAVARSNADLQRVIDQIVEHEQIERASTQIVLATHITRRTLPLVQAAAAAEGSNGGAAGNVNAFTKAITSSAGQAFLILIREGLEALLVVAAVVAYLVKSGNQRFTKWIYLGVLAGLAGSGLVAVLFTFLFGGSGPVQEISEGVCALIAMLMLLWTSNWMLNKSSVEAWNRYIRTKTESAVADAQNKVAAGEGVGLGMVVSLAMLSFLAVFREGAETVIFYESIYSMSRDAQGMWIGGIAAGVVLLVIFLVLRFTSVKIPIGPFFLVTSILMAVLVVIFAGGGIHALIEGDLIDGHYLSSVPTNDWIGLYPYVECLAAQAIAAIAVLALFAVGFARKRKLRTPDNRK